MEPFFSRLVTLWQLAQGRWKRMPSRFVPLCRTGSPCAAGEVESFLLVALLLTYPFHSPV